jgi:type IV secretory pathway TraG/TraD family ATPase VirD4
MGFLKNLIFGKPNTSHGNARFQNSRERNELFTKKSDGGFCVDGVHHLRLLYSFKNLLLVSPVGGGKSILIQSGFLRKEPNHSFVCVDPNHEHYETSKYWLEKQGFVIKRISLDTIGGLQYNFFEHFHPEYGISDFIALFLDLYYEGNAAKDPFWKNSKALWLKLIIVALLHPEQDMYPKNIISVIKIVNKLKVSQPEVDDFMGRFLPEEYFDEYLSLMGASEEKTFQSIIMSLKSALEQLNTPVLRYVLEKDSLNFQELRSRPTALFIHCEEQRMPKLKFVLSILIKQLLEFAMKPKIAGRPYLPIQFIFEEFNSMHFDIENYLVVLRKKQCSIVIVIQDFSQLEKLGSSAMKTVLSNCVSRIIYPGVSPEVALWAQNLIGNTTIVEGDNVYGKLLLSAQEIRTLKSNQLLFLHGNQNPTILTLKPWFKQYNLKRRTKD